MMRTIMNSAGVKACNHDLKLIMEKIFTRKSVFVVLKLFTHNALVLEGLSNRSSRLTCSQESRKCSTAEIMLSIYRISVQ